jgi:hypothetical protein
MLDCHVNAFLIVPGRVLGRKLRHLTLRHLWLLEAADSPYAFRAPPAYSDTVFAVFLLSLPFPVARWVLMHPRVMAWWVSLWARRHKGIDIAGDMASFADYWDTYTAQAEVWEAKGALHRSCLPSSVKIAWAIMGKVSERRAWSMPLPLAMAYFTAEAEFNGQEFKTEHQKAMAKLNANFGKEPANA